ncbi:unnamed protein product [marine sediment metagenome]|uniref:Uncharacterized protein n=1 Tax=marine sediment metagenome TaxID=412755 RepID=X0XT07_9ZZZZ
MSISEIKTSYIEPFGHDKYYYFVIGKNKVITDSSKYVLTEKRNRMLKDMNI